MTFRGFWFGKGPPPEPISKRYRDGIASYGKPVKSEKRKARILAELNAMGVKPRIRVKAGRRQLTHGEYRMLMNKRMQTTRFIKSPFNNLRRYP